MNILNRLFTTMLMPNIDNIHDHDDEYIHNDDDDDNHDDINDIQYDLKSIDSGSETDVEMDKVTLENRVFHTMNTIKCRGSGRYINLLSDTAFDSDDMEESNNNEYIDNRAGEYSDNSDNIEYNETPTPTSHYTSTSGNDNDNNNIHNTLRNQLKSINKKNITKSQFKAILSSIDWNPHSLEDVKHFVNDNFTADVVSLSSTHLDIISSYLNSQKMIYMESSHYTSKMLNLLMVPTILISASASVISGTDNLIPNSSLIISGITAFSAFLLAIINYLKLDAASEAHKISAHQYDKLQSHIMFFSGKTLLFSEASFSYHTFHDRLGKKQLEAKTQLLSSLDDDMQVLKDGFKEKRFSTKNDITHIESELNNVKNEYNTLLKCIEKNTNREGNDTLVSMKNKIDELEGIRDLKKNKYKEDKNHYRNDINHLINSKTEYISRRKDEVKVELSEEENKIQSDLMMKIRDEINNVQEKIKDIKEINQFEVPREIRYRYPYSYNANVFSLIKTIDEYKSILIVKLWIVRNGVRFCKCCIKECNRILRENNLTIESKKMIEDEIDKLIIYKKQSIERLKLIYETIITLTTAYIEVDRVFMDEMENAERRKNWWWCLQIFPCIICFMPKLKKTKNSLLGKIITSMTNSFNIHAIEQKEHMDAVNDLDIIV